jgi:hypothetical protein
MDIFPAYDLETHRFLIHADYRMNAFEFLTVCLVSLFLRPQNAICDGTAAACHVRSAICYEYPKESSLFPKGEGLSELLSDDVCWSRYLCLRDCRGR